ncbi:C6 transcription factor, putative [Paecilomyces variotii No. 5]|uniref:C6 transcription factor, putative n=1 Tax=Byssochlamys spectabilis (strain No. 5 / NBRC 109023) TaxID=1356009 RepID=V5G9W5_BYSSN|nr:C6 transcription factor, putative [Paecilomyces variotii No. 5]
MQSLLLPHLSFPERRFRESGLNVDPGRLSLNLSWSNNACGSIRAPYPSPPMSGSPLKENQSDASGGQDQRQSESNVSLTDEISRSIPPPSAPVIGESEPRRLQYAQEQGAFTERREMIHDPLLASQPPAFSGEISASAETAYATAGLPPTGKNRSLPPKTTRRTKAHVASACVNCKRKHLGCDSARPCRRCVVAGKAASCVDVTHKKRGRPPLKAEETPVRPYAPSSNDPSASRDVSHFSPSNRAHFHRRTSSREIRPITDLQLPQANDPTGNRVGGSGLGAASIPAQRWPPSVYPSPQRFVTSPSLPHGLNQRPVSAGSSQHSIAAQSPFVHSAGPGSSAAYPPISPYYERPQTPTRPLVSEPTTLAEFRGQQVEPGLRLPPILPSPDRHSGQFGPDPRRSHSYPTPWSSRPWFEQNQEQHIQPRSLEIMEPIARHTQSYQPLAGHNHHERAMRNSVVSAVPAQQYPSRMSPPRASAEQLRRASGSGDTDDPSPPTKRRRMTLDDIVND